MTREAVRSELAAAGMPLADSRESLDYFCDNALQVEYGEDARADFIGVSSSEHLLVTYFDIDVFDTLAEHVFAAIARRETSGVHEYDPLEYLFPQQIVTLWDAADQYDHRGGQQRVIWAQIGVGTERYLSDVRRLAGG
jgi:hypothetical protein